MFPKGNFGILHAIYLAAIGSDPWMALAHRLVSAEAHLPGQAARHNKYAISKTNGVQESIIPNITASMVVTEISSVRPPT
jgi:hypothetical protein